MSFAFYTVSIIALLATIPASVFLSKKYSQSSDEIHPLIKDRLFLFSIYMSASISIVISAIIIVESISSGEYYLDFSSQGFVNAFELFKAPISILAAGFAAAALIAAIHRSKETNIQIQKINQQIKNTEIQIKKTDDKNTFENYIKHRDEVIKELSAYEGKYLIKEISSKNIVYKRIFSKNFFDHVEFGIPDTQSNKYKHHYSNLTDIFLTEKKFDSMSESFNSYSYILRQFNINYSHSLVVEISGVKYKFPVAKKYSIDDLKNNNFLIRSIRTGIHAASILTYRVISISGGSAKYYYRDLEYDVFIRNIKILLENDEVNVKYVK